MASTAVSNNGAVPFTWPCSVI